MHPISLLELFLPTTWPANQDHRLTIPIWDSRPSFKKDAITENKDVNVWIEKYLGLGEWVMDQSVTIAGSSGWFERKR